MRDFGVFLIAVAYGAVAGIAAERAGIPAKIAARVNAKIDEKARHVARVMSDEAIKTRGVLGSGE